MSRSEPTAAGKRVANEPPEGDQPPKRTKKGKKKATKAPVGSGPELYVGPQDYAKLIPVNKKTDKDEEASGPVQLSRLDKAAQLQLSDDKLIVTGWKGYRTVRATHGVHEGTWYCEVTVTHLGETGHCRLGWSSKKAELQAPVGYDKHGYSYRDLEGSKVHQALREPYGEAFGEGDVIGLLIHLPSGGKSTEKHQSKSIVKYKGALYYVDEKDPDPQPLAGSCVLFTKNGVVQGVAYENLLEATYHPSASLYTLPTQGEGCTVKFNFGPTFQHPPPVVKDLPAAQPLSDVSGGRPAAITA